MASTLKPAFKMFFLLIFPSSEVKNTLISFLILGSILFFLDPSCLLIYMPPLVNIYPIRIYARYPKKYTLIFSVLFTTAAFFLIELSTFIDLFRVLMHPTIEHFFNFLIL